MRRVADEEVERALIALAGRRDAGPVLWAERVRRIVAVRDEAAPEARARRLVAIARELLAAVEPPGTAPGPALAAGLSATGRAMVETAMDRFRDDLRAEIAQTADRALAGGRPVPPRPGRIPV